MKKLTFDGNLGQDGELKPAGQSIVLNFSVAVEVRGKDGKETNWVRCALWGKRAEAIAPFMTKGKKVLVTGSHKIRTYQDQSGKEGFSEECDVDDITFFDVARQEQRPQGGQPGPGYGPPQHQQGGYQQPPQPPQGGSGWGQPPR